MHIRKRTDMLRRYINKIYGWYRRTWKKPGERWFFILTESKFFEPMDIVTDHDGHVFMYAGDNQMLILNNMESEEERKTKSKQTRKLIRFEICLN